MKVTAEFSGKLILHVPKAPKIAKSFSKKNKNKMNIWKISYRLLQWPPKTWLLGFFSSILLYFLLRHQAVFELAALISVGYILCSVSRTLVSRNIYYFRFLRKPGNHTNQRKSQGICNNAEFFRKIRGYSIRGRSIDIFVGHVKGNTCEDFDSEINP